MQEQVSGPGPWVSKFHYTALLSLLLALSQCYEIGFIRLGKLYFGIETIGPGPETRS